MKTTRNYFPIGDKAIISFEDVPTVVRIVHTIYVGEDNRSLQI